MTWQVQFTSRAERDFRALDSVVATRVAQAISRLTDTGLGDVRALQGRDRELRLRVGQWRVILVYDRPQSVINVLRILPRGRAYR